MSYNVDYMHLYNLKMNFNNGIHVDLKTMIMHLYLLLGYIYEENEKKCIENDDLRAILKSNLEAYLCPL